MGRYKKIVSFKSGNNNNANGTTLFYKDKLVTDPSLIAETFNDFFINIGSDIARKIPKSKATYNLFLCNSV